MKHNLPPSLVHVHLYKLHVLSYDSSQLQTHKIKHGLKKKSLNRKCYKNIMVTIYNDKNKGYTILQL